MSRKPDWRKIDYSASSSLPIKMAAEMEAKLSANDHKGVWYGCRLQYLSMRITQEKKELIAAIKRGASPEEVWAEAADIANFAAMIADNYADGSWDEA